ncbi:trypsin-1-like isoform X1 [Clavelina lepadiformis]|uniref:trypsin-1-like isoform X1 n=1 Tax=Clavelina lepadiformis TaxID=159417 RepID=UPI004043317F
MKMYGMFTPIFILAYLVYQATARNVGLVKQGHQRIVGGTSAAFGELPWQGYLTTSSGQYCGCSLLSSTWAITAAHCTAGSSATDLTVAFGQIDRRTFTSAQEYSIAELHDHPSYSGTTLENDISLLKIDGSISVGGNVQTISIPATQGVDVTAGTSCLISGWGTTSFGGTSSDVLLKATVPIISDTDCVGWYSSFGFTVYTSVQLCAGYQTGGTDTCQGDSGGPLACQDSSGTYYLEGLTSWGVGCAYSRRPGVYTRMSEYVEWINSTSGITPLSSSVATVITTSDEVTTTGGGKTFSGSLFVVILMTTVQVILTTIF